MVLLKRDLSSALVGARARGGTPGVNKRQVASPFLAGDLHLHPHHSPRKRATQVLAVSTSTYTQSVSNAEFASRARDLERKGVSTFDVGSTMDVLLEGDAGFEVEELQRYLQEEGFYTSSYGVTGYFGPITKQALIKWQKANGVLATGNFGGMSRAKYLDLQEQKLQGKKSGKKVSLFGGRKKKVKAPPKQAKRVAASSLSDVKTKSTKSFGKKSSQQVVSVSQPQTLQKGKVRKGISWGTTLVFFVTLVVCWQTFSMYYKQKEERKLERQRMERDRAVQISRWMRTIDTDRRA